MRKSDAHRHAVDLRDLRMLSHLIETRSVTRTAEALGLSQPAASRALDKLRRALGDRIVVRAGAGAALTARGETLAAQLAPLLTGLDRLFAPEAFDPATARAPMRFAATDYGATVVVGPLAAHLQAHAPGIQLDVAGFDGRTFERLAAGGLDFALYADAGLPADFHGIDLFRETYACLLRANHPALDPRLDDAGRLRRLAQAPRAVMLFPDGRRILPDDVLAELLGDASAAPAFRTPFFFSAPAAVAASDLVMCLPSRAASAMAAAPGLRAIPLPGAAGFTYRLIWHARCADSPAHAWVRQTLRALWHAA